MIWDLHSKSGPYPNTTQTKWDVAAILRSLVSHDAGLCFALPEEMLERGSEGVKNVSKTGGSVCGSPARNVAADVVEFPFGLVCLAADIIPGITELNCSERGDTKLCVYSSSLYLIKHQFLCV